MKDGGEAEKNYYLGFFYFQLLCSIRIDPKLHTYINEAIITVTVKERQKRRTASSQDISKKSEDHGFKF